MTLTPFISGGETFLHGRWAIENLKEPTEIVAKPDAAGGLTEICVYREQPPL